MAYINRSSGNMRGGTIAAVAALHVAAAWALINGLGIDYVKEHVFNLPAKNYLADPPPPEPMPEPPKAEPAADRARITTTRDPVIAKPNALVINLPPVERPSIPDLLPPIPQPGPTIDPGPRFDPVGAKPSGRPGNWVSTNDYPTRDIRQGNEGTVAFRLAIDSSGKVRGCEILKSSGHPGLDAATCDRLTKRATFEPARDETGSRVAGSYSGTVRWEIPE